MNERQFQQRIARAVARADVRDILDTLDIKFRQQSYGDLWYRCVVRNHRSDKTASAHIAHLPGHPHHGLWHCFGCGLSGNVVTLVQQVRDVRFKEALMMVEHHQLTEDVEVVKPFDKKGMRGLPVLYQSPALEEDWDQEYLSYLVKRHITWKQIVDHRIGYVDAGRLHKRIIVPVLMNHRLQTWIGRHIDPEVSDAKRYTSAPGGNVGLFGSELANPYQDPAIVCEGWADALAVERLGFSNCMAVQTSRLHPEQYKYISMFRYTIVIPDGDEAGDKFIDSLAPYVQDHPFLIAHIPDGKDPADLHPDELGECIDKATDWEPSGEKYGVEVDY